MSELLMIEQRPGRSRETLAGGAGRFGDASEVSVSPIGPRFGQRDEAPWVLEGGRRLPGHDDNRRLVELRRGLVRHAGVHAVAADACDEELELTLSALHLPSYLRALRSVRSDEPVVLPELAPPGLPVDIPVRAGLVAAAREAVRTGITAAQRVAGGAHFAYALCRPPGHHAGPGWLAGYCYLNTAAAAVMTLRRRGVCPVGVLDLDLHYPNGTAALLAPLHDTRLHSLHAFPVTNVPAGTVCPRSERERVVEFTNSPSPEEYLEAVAASVETLAETSRVLVVSLGYDTVAGDPHGSWTLPPSVFAGVGRLLAGAGPPVCVIQEGGYRLSVLADCSDAFATGLLGGGGGAADRPHAVCDPHREIAARRTHRAGVERAPA